MNRLLKLVLFVFITPLQLYSQGQQLVQMPKDIVILCQKEEQFLGKSLVTILKEVKPSIKYVFGGPGEGARPNVLYFCFVPANVFNQYRRQGKFPLMLRVYVKEDFEWYESRQMLARSKRNEWSKADQEKYGHLTITKIGIGGEYNACDYETEQNL